MAASIHIQKYSRLKKNGYSALTVSTEIRCSEIGNKDFLTRSRRQKPGFSIKLTTLAVDYSFCIGPTGKKVVRENSKSYLGHVRG